MIRQGSFRLDLYYRINILQINAPGLNEIPEDIPQIAYHLLSLLNKEIGGSSTTISDGAMRVLTGYHWPGNVRELRNVLERAVIVSNGNEISRKTFRPDSNPRPTGRRPSRATPARSMKYSPKPKTG